MKEAFFIQCDYIAVGRDVVGQNFTTITFANAFIRIVKGFAAETIFKTTGFGQAGMRAIIYIQSSQGFCQDMNRSFVDDDLETKNSSVLW